MRAGALAIFHRAIAELMNVKPVLTRLKTIQIGVDLDAIIGLLERHLAIHFVIAQPAYHRDCESHLAHLAAQFRRSAASRFSRRTPSRTAFLRLRIAKL